MFLENSLAKRPEYIVNLKKLSYHQILSKDSVTINVDAVVYFNIFNPVMSIKNITDVGRATRLLAQTTLRNIMGAHTLAEVLSAKDTLQQQMTVRSDSSSRFQFQVPCFDPGLKLQSCLCDCV